MAKWLIVFICFSVASYAAETACLDAKVTMPNGKLSLKQALKTLSDQCSCTFSYNPVAINDAQILNITNISNIPLSKALSKIFEAKITFSVHGKYILLQLAKEKSNVKAKSKIDNDPKKVALIIPKLENNFDIAKRDSLLYIKPTVNIALAVDSSQAMRKSEEPFYAAKLDPDEVRRAKIADFLKRNVHTQIGISSSSSLSSVFAQLGMYGFYGIATLSTDYNNSYRMGYGAAYQLKLRGNMDISLQFEQNLLFAGLSYDLGVRAVYSHIDLLANFAISRDFVLFLGPSLYSSTSSYIFTNTELDKVSGLGLVIGVRFDIISALLSKK